MKVSKYLFISLYLFLTSFLSSLSFLYFFSLNKSILVEIELMSVNSILYHFIFYLDWVCFMFIFIVTLISSLIFIYSSGYMGQECKKFLWLTFLFILFMLFMILSPSVLGVLLGWDGLGLISYCLVIYYQSSDSFNSGFITAATNRLGDAFLIVSVVWLSMDGEFGFWDSMKFPLFFVLACMTKSAQFPFSAWLPAAMAAPTPISSLVHSSTLVTAGVYMLIRFFFNFCETGGMIFLLIMSLFTVFCAGVMSLQEMDMKRLIALSTLGQLGFMMVILCLGYFYIALFHLLIHALFKALLFMCGGFIIHSSLGVQDLRKMGNLHYNNLIKVSLLVSSASLMGVPFSSGFYSKDALLELIMCSYGGLGMGLFMISMALLTVTYSFRFFKCLSSNGSWVVWMSSDWDLNMSVYLLCMINIFMGFILNMFISELYLVSLSTISKILPLVLLISGVVWSGVSWFSLSKILMISSLMYLNPLSSGLMSMMYLQFMNYKLLDQGWLEGSLKMIKIIILKYSFWMKNFLTDFFYFSSVGVLITLFMLM
uniref:NADH-ubiquinone oxidoreductase chain 5 n=1 Tax=Calophya californica TaxID=2047826 RepID=A0A343LDP2_9HEMI|nr:NADH dehydrogenase subunit 5 [Calophya californica]ATN42467.1 NADH dehydrogenase subunit 5 [Calophya californica]